MLIIHLPLGYDNLEWINSQFKRDLCLFKFKNFPKSEVSRGSWIAIHLDSEIHFMGKLNDVIQVINSKVYRIYLKSLIGFKPIEYQLKNVMTKYDFANIKDIHVNGRHFIKINKDTRVVPNFPKY